jgi:hypothetical protein
MMCNPITQAPNLFQLLAEDAPNPMRREIPGHIRQHGKQVWGPNASVESSRKHFLPENKV